MIANTAGSALFVAQEAWLGQQTVRMKFSYAPSPYAQYRPWVLGESHGQRFFQDYNGHTYWLSLNLKSVNIILIFYRTDSQTFTVIKNQNNL